MPKNSLAVFAVFSLLCACSHSRTVTTQNGASVTVDQAKDGAGSVHAVGKDGTSVDINVSKKVTDYPGDVPLYQGVSTMDMKSPEKHARVLVLQTPDPMDKISNFYKSQFDDKGWKVEATMTTDKMVMYKASKDNREMVVQVGSDGGKQTISQTLADK
jgi:hypothetical protein